MNELTASSWEAISVRVGALLAVRDSLLEGAAGAEDSARRLAHAIAGFARHRNIAKLAEIAFRVERGDGGAPLLAGVDEILAALRNLANSPVERTELVLLVGAPAWTIPIAQALASDRREVITCPRSAEAIPILASRPVTVLVLELDLPDGDGRDVLANLPQSGCSRPSAIVLSPVDGLLARSECFALGADAYLEKPVDPAPLLATIAGQLAKAGEVRRETHRDLMTRLPNRRGLAAAFARLSGIRPAGSAAGSLAMIDLDYFKLVNDTFGHGVGDDVLCRTGELMRVSLGPADLLARWGGEEFVALLPASPPLDAFHTLTQTLEIVRDEEFRCDGRSFHITFSAGIAPFFGGEALEDAVRSADRQLYEAKRSGRGRIVVEAPVGPAN